MTARLLNAERRLFDASEWIGVGMQASLEIAVDTTAVRDRWETPPQREAALPGQLEIEREDEEEAS